MFCGEQSFISPFPPCFFGMTRVIDGDWNTLTEDLAGTLWLLPQNFHATRTGSWSREILRKCGTCLHVLANSKFIHSDRSLGAKFLPSSAEPPISWKWMEPCACERVWMAGLCRGSSSDQRPTAGFHKRWRTELEVIRSVQLSTFPLGVGSKPTASVTSSLSLYVQSSSQGPIYTALMQLG